MKKRSLLFLVLFATFTGGFLSGVFYSDKTSQTSNEMTASGLAPQSFKNPERKPDLEIKPQDSKVLIGYVQDYRNPDEIEYKNFTTIIFSFAHPTADGNLLLNGDQALNNLRVIVKKAKQHDTKVMLAIGGWFHINGGESYDYFRAAISNPDSRKKLVNELVSLSEREKLDGIDIDFEHPRSKADAQLLTAFSRELSDLLQPKGKELSIAVNAKVHSVTGTEIHSVVFEPAMFRYFDHVNLMAYDGHWDGDYNAANLSPYTYSENIINYWTKLFDQYGYSRNKLVLGVPLYAQPEDPEKKQVSYDALLKNSLANASTDTAKMNGTTYHYNGHSTLQKKTSLAVNNQLGGMMLWEAGLDAQGSQSASTLIANSLELASKKGTKYFSNK